MNKYLIFAILLITPFTPFIDQSIASFFFQKNYTYPILEFIYTWAIVPAQIVAVLALIAVFFKKWRTPALYLILVLAVGGGLITHVALKDHWGRPRPRQVIEYGGTQEFRPFWKPNFFNQPEPSKAFPCGHCVMGFYFFSFVFLGKYYHKKWLTLLGWSLSTIIGISLGITRMAQGGHFFSDVLFSAVIMWFSALIIFWSLYERTNKAAA